VKESRAGPALTGAGRAARRAAGDLRRCRENTDGKSPLDRSLLVAPGLRYDRRGEGALARDSRRDDMWNGTVLDVAVGLTFVFFMLSVACSMVNERIQGILEKRSRMLEQAVRQLLGDEAQSPFEAWKNHPLIRAMSHGHTGLPSYIPSATFTQALFDTLVPADGEHPLTVKRLGDAIQRLPATGRTQLLALVNSAEGDVTVARGHVERWFDTSMERLSGAYKRHVTVWMFAIGFVLAAATNADGIQLFRRLEHETALRTTLTAHIDRTAAAQAGPAMPHTIGSGDLEQIEQMDLLFWDTSALVSDAREAASHPRAAWQPELSTTWLCWLALKIAGCLLTALAASIGAPFWFDLFGRLVNLRATGPKPAPKPAAPG
jgi:hypothetical protein